jgi:hypothetical protein
MLIGSWILQATVCQLDHDPISGLVYWSNPHCILSGLVSKEKIEIIWIPILTWNQHGYFIEFCKKMLFVDFFGDQKV